MVYGGIGKFTKPIPAPTAMMEQFADDTKKAALQADVETLKIRNYIFGLKQTNYFWQMLGVCEILFGLLLLSQFMAFAGAVMLLGVTLNIFLFHVFLEPHDLKELLLTGFLFAVNIVLVLAEKDRCWPLLWFKPFYPASKPVHIPAPPLFLVRCEVRERGQAKP